MDSLNILFMEAENIADSLYDSMTICVLESGDDEYEAIFEAASKAVEKKKEGLLARIKKIIDAAIAKIKGFFESIAHKNNQKKMAAALKADPSIKNKKVKGINFKKADEESKKAISAVKKAKTEKQVEDVKKKWDAKKSTILAGSVMTVGAVIGGILYVKNKPADLKKTQKEYNKYFEESLNRQDTMSMAKIKNSNGVYGKGLYKVERNIKNKKAAKEYVGKNTADSIDYLGKNVKDHEVLKKARRANDKTLGSDYGNMVGKWAEVLDTERAKTNALMSILSDQINLAFKALDSENKIVERAFGMGKLKATQRDKLGAHTTKALHQAINERKTTTVAKKYGTVVGKSATKPEDSITSRYSTF